MKNILVMFLIISLVFMPLVSAATGEDNVKVIRKDGTSDTNSIEEKNSSNDDDYWGIKKSDMDYTSYANIKELGGIYSGITPFRNMSMISIAISLGLALTFVLVGIFLLVMVAGYGAGHPNVEKGWKYLNSARGKIIALGGIFVLALFIIITIFFSLYVFSRISISI
ncbi:MAG: hypothetical protein PHS36_05630 [Candidatus Cloacimonetes bacterium]|nr:hypothetical protein [Candidatus Cloacimonadota bacterium]